MQMVTAIVFRLELSGMTRIPGQGIEINQGVISAAGADPRVYSLAHDLTFRTVISRALIRGERSAEHLDSVRVRPFYHLAQTGDKFIGGDRGLQGTPRHQTA